MLDVIEHLQDPINTFDLIYENMNKGGILIIATGDFDSGLSKLMKMNWRLMTPHQHIFYFSKHSLTQSLKKIGIRIKEVSYPWKFVPLSLIFYQLARMLIIRININIKKTYGLKVNLFDALRVISIK